VFRTCCLGAVTAAGSSTTLGGRCLELVGREPLRLLLPPLAHLWVSTRSSTVEPDGGVVERAGGGEVGGVLGIGVREYRALAILLLSTLTISTGGRSSSSTAPSPSSRCKPSIIITSLALCCSLSFCSPSNSPAADFLSDSGRSLGDVTECRDDDVIATPLSHRELVDVGLRPLDVSPSPRICAVDCAGLLSSTEHPRPILYNTIQTYYTVSQTKPHP